MYPEVQLGFVFLALVMLVIPFHGPCHGIVLMLPLLLLDLNRNTDEHEPTVAYYQGKAHVCLVGLA